MILLPTQQNDDSTTSSDSTIMPEEASGPTDVANSDSKNSLSSSSYESASSALSECGEPVSLNGSPLYETKAETDTETEEEEEVDDGHHSDTCGTNDSNGGLDTTSPETTNSTGDSSYHTYPYVSIRKYASALDLSKPIDLSTQLSTSGTLVGPDGEVTKMSDASTFTEGSINQQTHPVDYSSMSHSHHLNTVSSLHSCFVFSKKLIFIFCRQAFSSIMIMIMLVTL